MKSKRDYISEDASSIRKPDMSRMRQIRDPQAIDCQCCEQTFYPTKKGQEIYLWQCYSDTLDNPYAKLLYCKACLPHFGATSCPSRRS